MFKICKHCNAVFKGEGYFCSDVCEIKNHAPKIIRSENVITPETKKELPSIPTLIENRGLTQVETNLKIKNKVLETPTLS